MDVDDDMMHERTKDENLFAKSSELTAAFYSHLPVEVKQILKNAGASFNGTRSMSYNCLTVLLETSTAKDSRERLTR